MLVNAQESQLCQRRVLKELRDINNDPIPNIQVLCDPKDHLNWYCRIHDLSDEEYKDGEFIFNIKLSPRYPFEPPDFFMLTPNGRFSTNCKICFSNSNHHKEAWSPIWTLRTMIIGFLSFFLEKESKGIGHLEIKSKEQIQAFSSQSKSYNQTHLEKILNLYSK